MNIKKKSIIIPAFALLIGASLAGSVTGTVAWYQYSTRVNAAYVGVSGGTSGNLKMRIRDGSYGESGDWETFLTKDAISAYLDSTSFGGKVLPITSGNMGKTSAVPSKFYSNPVYGVEGGYASAWKEADSSSYIVLPLQLCFVQSQSANDNINVVKNNVAKAVYLTDLYLAEDASNETNNKGDLSDALRFHICAYEEGTAVANRDNFLLSKNGGTTMTNGKLDLDGDGNPDVKYDDKAVKYGFSTGESTPITYGVGQQVSFSSALDDASNVAYYNSDGTAAGTDEKVYSLVADASTDPLSKTKYNSTISKSIGSTVEGDSKYLNVDITIWLEGWQTLGNDHKASWDLATYLNSKFDIGFEFSAE